MTTDMTALDIGNRLKFLRESKGISQRRLATAAGVTNGLISQIEQNKTSPSVATLHRILNALSLSMVDFFSTEIPDANQPKYFYRFDEMRNVSPAGHGRETRAKDPKAAPGIDMRAVGNVAQNALLMMHETYAPGADTGTPYSHEGEEAGFIVSGTLEVTVGDHVGTLGAGDAYIFDSALPHRFRNIGTETCLIISASTSGKRKSPA